MSDEEVKMENSDQAGEEEAKPTPRRATRSRARAKKEEGVEADKKEPAPKKTRARRTKKSEAEEENSAATLDAQGEEAPEAPARKKAKSSEAAAAKTGRRSTKKSTGRSKAQEEEAKAEVETKEDPSAQSELKAEEASASAAEAEKPRRRRSARLISTKEERSEVSAKEEGPDTSSLKEEQPEGAEEASQTASADATSADLRPGRSSSQARVSVRKTVVRQQGQGATRQGQQRFEGSKQSRTHTRQSESQGSHRLQRQRRSGSNREVQPSVSLEELSQLKVTELRAKAEELELDVKGMLKADLVQAVYDASVKAEGFEQVEGVLDVLSDGYGFVRTQGYLPSDQDCYVALSFIRRNGLRKGDLICGQTRPARDNEKYAALQKITSVNGIAPEDLSSRVKFADLTPIYPDECLVMEHGKNTITARVIDLVSPIGKGQRGLIVSPPKAGKTTILKDIAAAITANNPEVHLMCLLVDERPEEVTDMQRSIKGEVISSTFDMPTENHIAVAELVIERAKRLVECGRDVVILLDSITRLARAYNLAQPASGRILSGGVDSTALYPPKRFLGAARNIENGGSLTILASALIDTGSKMDEVIFEEFKGTGNMELRLDRNLSDRRIFPAIDPVASGTRKEDLLLDAQQAPLIWAVRRLLANMNNTERAMDMLIKSLKQTDTNTEFLLRTAKKAQHAKADTFVEL